MEIKYRKIASFSIIVLFVAWVVYYFTTHISDFKQLSLVNPIYLIPLFFIFLIVSITNGLVIKYFLEPFNIKIKFKEWFGLSVITSFYNMVTPFRGGAFVKAAYLNKKHSFSYSNFLATFSGVYVVTFLISSFIGLISLVLLYKNYHIFNLLIFLAFSGVFIPLLLIVLISPKLKPSKNKFLNQFINIINGWYLVKQNKIIVFKISIITLIQLVLGSVSTIISYSLFGINISIIQALFLTSIGTLGILISITPASLGVAEAIAVFSGLIIGITPAQALAVSVLGRAISIIVIFILGPLFSYILFKKISIKKENEAKNQRNLKK